MTQGGIRWAKAWLTYTIQNGTQLKTYELFIYKIFHLKNIFRLLTIAVTETTESKTGYEG